VSAAKIHNYKNSVVVANVKEMHEAGKVVVAISGYFDPPTPAHIRYMWEARQLGDRLVVILNNDHQLLLKRKGTRLEGRVRYPFADRMEIISNLRPVDDVVESVDDDETVAETIKLLCPDVFAKGGDRTLETLPKAEVDACEVVGCKIVCNVGGKKTHSSSWYNWE